MVLKGGKSPGGAAAARSHTASMAGNGAVVSGALAQVGVVEAAGFKQMMDFCRTLAEYPRVPVTVRGRVAILTYSGGSGIVSADGLDALRGAAGAPDGRHPGRDQEGLSRLDAGLQPGGPLAGGGAKRRPEGFRRRRPRRPGRPRCGRALQSMPLPAASPWRVDLTEIAADAKRRAKPVICWLLVRCASPRAASRPPPRPWASRCCAKFRVPWNA